ncbi:hemerythrin domain-containing protein [Curvibacter sp. CHRR-16]|uniref:hemerythrin domain-containing protein n=1 Tax=Curvibacter sp. CHRR-16 TaxID=2835872 RepID=UPI001BD973B2|nr:hemerythrin domain-containing protein [Curvibacter sp. CHRR-16]MBT0571136.1 hemerythrin domain-containing protein [Curvibacter sp. CHRR-16]
MSSVIQLHAVCAPSSGWEQPFAMLKACHERVQRMLVLLQRLQVHVGQHGVDGEAIEAAQDVMRYFDKAAPLHHLDEEEQIFPLALVHGTAEVQHAVQRLQHEHAKLDAMWQTVRSDLKRLLQADVQDREFVRAWPSDPAVAAFVLTYTEHVRMEEVLVYPCVEALLTHTQEREIGSVMAARRMDPVAKVER